MLSAADEVREGAAFGELLEKVRGELFLHEPGLLYYIIYYYILYIILYIIILYYIILHVAGEHAPGFGWEADLLQHCDQELTRCGTDRCRQTTARQRLLLACAAGRDVGFRV